MERFHLTTAIDYVNSKPHLGTAYEKITADVIARYKRRRGVATHFLMGNDEHSANVRRRAGELGLDPLAYCDRMEDTFREVWRRLEVSFDDFIRTSEPRHHAAVRKLLTRIRDAGDLYEGVYEGWYCVSCESFKQEKDLLDGACPVHRAKPDWIREKNHFFRLSAFRDRLMKLYEEQPRFLSPEIRRNELERLLEGGLSDLSVSRPGSGWGIPVPFDPGSVVYVWFDALTNYLSATGYGAGEPGWDQRWPADVHIVGKDITRFHAVIWPAMLMSAGVALPRMVFGHGFVNFEGQRMSKSLGKVVDPLEAADHFGADALRFYLIREIQYGHDGDFSWDRFEARYDADLANSLGNLVSRITTMAARYRGGRLAPSGRSALPEQVNTAVARYEEAMDDLALHRGADEAFGIVSGVNEFLTQRAPWKLARDPEADEQLDEALYEAAEATRVAAVLLAPVMPGSAARILDRLGGDETARFRTDRVLSTTTGDPLWPRLRK